MVLDEKKIEAYIAQMYFQLYNEVEKNVKEIFLRDFSNEMSLDLKQRLLYFAGWLFCDIRMVDFDTYSLKREIRQYDEEKVLKNMTLKQIMKFCEKEPSYNRFDFALPSVNKKMETISFYACCGKWIDMRNKLAHLFEDFDFSKNIIEVLSVEELKRNNKTSLEDSDIEKLSDNGKYILSNFMYLQNAYEIIKRN